MHTHQEKGNENAQNLHNSNATPARQFHNPHSPYQTKQGAKPPIEAKQRPIKAKQAPVQRTQTKPPVIHTVKKGDTYSTLAQKYGVTVEQLRAWNGFADEAIPIGAQLLVSDPMKMTDEELQDYINNFDLNKYLGQMGVPSVGDDSASKNQPRNPDPSVVGGYTQLGQVPRDFRGKQFYDHKGKPKSHNAVFTSKNMFSGSAMGSGSVSTWDYLKRQKYIAKVSRTAQAYLRQFDAQTTSWGKLMTMHQASNARNEGRNASRKGLSWGAKKLSENLDSKQSIGKLLAKYKLQNPNMPHEELARLITEKSGSSNSSLLKFNKYSRILGPVGIAVGFGIAAYNIYDEPTLETAAGELMAMLGGGAGMSIGMGLVAAGLGALGAAPLTIIIGAAAGGFALGMLTATVGKAIGREVGKWLDGLFD